jgi:hypothetical protein
MFADGFSFLEEEREAWRPFEALIELTDDQLQAPIEGTHGWCGRDLMGHLLAWMGNWLAISRELAVGPASPTWDWMKSLSDRWESEGDAINARYQAEWAALPMAEIRSRFVAYPGELRGYLTVVPESRWLKDPERLGSLLGNTTEHYAEHMAELAAILAAAGR